MSLRLAVDFGTATTAVAHIPNPATMVPSEIPLYDDGGSYAHSLVWFDRQAQSAPLLRSQSTSERHPKRLFTDARAMFAKYWTDRLTAKEDAHRWADWTRELREADMLLSYFKPELADFIAPDHVATRTRSVAVYDQMSQSEETTFEALDVRLIATPAPDTSDLVSGTAALIRTAVGRAVAHTGERVSVLGLGAPSFGDDKCDEALLAWERREEAVQIARIAEDYGARDFRLVKIGEATAATYSIEDETIRESGVVVVVDVGAGTTDLAAMVVAPGRGGLLVPTEELARGSCRVAGRDLNSAIAGALRQDQPFVRELYTAMDPRAWQLYLETWIEHAKLTITETGDLWILLNAAELDRRPSDHSLPLGRADVLKKAQEVRLNLSEDAFDRQFRRRWQRWLPELNAFVSRLNRAIGGLPIHQVALRGGGVRFPPLRTALHGYFDAQWPGVRVLDARDARASQLAIVRGMARQVMTM